MNLVIVDLPDLSNPYNTMNFPLSMALLMLYKLREINWFELYTWRIMCIVCVDISVYFFYFYIPISD